VKRPTDEAAKEVGNDPTAAARLDRAWPQFRAPVETHVQAFIDGKIALEQMAANLAAAVP
jgi:hypothetical protein